MIVEQEVETGDTVKKIVQLKPIPDVVEGRLTDAFNNARNSFDQALFAACTAIDQPIADGHYPWACYPSDLEWKFQNQKTGKQHIPVELCDTFRRQQPYPTGDGYEGGDTFIRSMATLANRKHTVGIDVGCNVMGVMTGPITINGPGKLFTVPSAKWDPVKKEIVLVRWNGFVPNFKQEPTVSFYVAFDAQTPLGLANHDAVRSIELFTKFAQRVVDDLKARAAELGAV